MKYRAFPASAPPKATVRGSGNRAASPGRLLLGVVLTGQFMALLDAFIVNVAAPTIRTDLHASGAQLQLVIAGYTISYAVLLVTGARTGDLWGHRRAFMAGLAAFTLASLACGVARTTGELIGFRFVQGACAALMIPQVLSLIQRLFTGEARARALSVYSAVLASGAAVGQSVGGALVSANLFGAGWRPVFLVNVPIGILMLLVAPRVIPRDAAIEPERRRGLDLPGLVLLAAAVTSLTVPLVLGEQEGRPLWGWLCMAGSVVLLGLLLMWEGRLSRRGGDPLVSRRVLRAPGMMTAMAVIVLTMAPNAGLLFALALHLQSGLGESAAQIGLSFLAGAVSFGGISLTWRRIPPRRHKALPPVGLILAAAGFGALGLLLRGSQRHEWGLLGCLLMVGGGLGLAFGPTLTAALGRVERRDAADASGLLQTVTQLGQLIGVAAFGTLYISRLAVAGPHPSAHAIAVTSLGLTATTVLGGALAGLRKA